MSIPVDFSLVNTWKVDTEGEKWADGTPKFITDKKMNQNYWNERPGLIRFKCFLLVLGTPIVHLYTSLRNIGEKIMDLFSGTISGKECAINIAATLIAYPGRELAALYGIIRPYDGRKLYASFERAIYGHEILAPCFQPYPRYHFFGGDPNVKDGL